MASCPLPGPISDIAYHNKAEAYATLLKAAAETLITIADDPKHLGGRIGLTAVLHTWDSVPTNKDFPMAKRARKYLKCLTTRPLDPPTQ